MEWPLTNQTRINVTVYQSYYNHDVGHMLQNYKILRIGQIIRRKQDKEEQVIGILVEWFYLEIRSNL